MILSTHINIFSSSQMKIYFLTIILLFSSFQEIVSQVDKPSILRSIPLLTRFESTDYNGGIQNWNLDQDSSGILYVANNEGLLEFDGSNWTKYDVPNCTKLRAVMVDHKNRIFVGGQGQIGYFTMTEKGLVFSSLLDKLPSHLRNVAETWKILEHDNKVFFNTESQLLVLDDTVLSVLEIPGYMRLAFEIDNRLLVEFYDIGLYEFANNEFIPIPGTDKIVDVISILPKKNGVYFLCASGFIFEYRNGNIIPIDIPFDLGPINVAIKLSSGEYAIGTQNDGLYIMNPDLSIKQHLTKNEGLSDRTIRSLYEDEFHNLWVALNNGIDYLQLSLPFSLINDEVGVEGTGYKACRYNDRFYFGTNNGLFIQKSLGIDYLNRKYELMKGSEGQVYNFSIVDNGLVLNHNNGAFQINENHLSKFHDIGSWKFMHTHIPDLILGGDYQGISLFKKEKNKWLKINSISDLNESSRIMEFENDSILWMTHGSKGAYRIQFDNEMNVKGTIDHFGNKNGFPSNILISVYSLNGKLVFTSENGIYNFNMDSFSFTPNSFFNKWLGTSHVSAIASNGSNKIYYVQDQKLGLLTQETFGTYKKETGLFKHINKFLNDDLVNISLLDEQNVIIGAKEGFIKYDPNKEFSINEDFHVLIRSVEIQSSADSTTIYYPYFIENKEIEINQSIKLKYASPFFDGFKDLKYSYRLLPLDENWSSWSSIGEKEYPYLPPNEYIFEVKALNVYDIESPISYFPFTVLKPWYLSGWAILFYIIMGFISIASIPLIQHKKFSNEKSIINSTKELALKQKNEEIDHISQESKKEITRLNNEKLRTEIDLKNDQLTTITMHSMNNNEFIQNVRNKIEANIEQGGSKHELRRIIKSIDENLSNNDSWDQFAYHFDQVHGDYLKKLSTNNVKLSPREIKLAAFLRMNMSSKEISNLMNITIRGVELARHRLRKKLNLKRDQNLVEYLIELDND